MSSLSLEERAEINEFEKGDTCIIDDFALVALVRGVVALSRKDMS